MDLSFLVGGASLLLWGVTFRGLVLKARVRF